jgi:hypothetical protein
MFDVKKYKKEFYEQRKEKYLADAKIRYQINKEKIKKKRRDDVKKQTPEQKEKRLAYHKWYNAQKKVKEANKKRTQEPAYRYKNYYLKRAQRDGRAFELSLDEFVGLYKADCFYCGIPESNGVDRVNNDIGYVFSNCVPCCTMCNKMKISHPKDVFLNHIQKIAKHNNMV